MATENPEQPEIGRNDDGNPPEVPSEADSDFETRDGRGDAATDARSDASREERPVPDAEEEMPTQPEPDGESDRDPQEPGKEEQPDSGRSVVARGLGTIGEVTDQLGDSAFNGTPIDELGATDKASRQEYAQHITSAGEGDTGPKDTDGEPDASPSKPAPDSETAQRNTDDEQPGRAEGRAQVPEHLRYDPHVDASPDEPDAEAAEPENRDTSVTTDDGSDTTDGGDPSSVPENPPATGEDGDVLRPSIATVTERQDDDRTDDADRLRPDTELSKAEAASARQRDLLAERGHLAVTEPLRPPPESQLPTAEPTIAAASESFRDPFTSEGARDHGPGRRWPLADLDARTGDPDDRTGEEYADSGETEHRKTIGENTRDLAKAVDHLAAASRPPQTLELVRQPGHDAALSAADASPPVAIAGAVAAIVASVYLGVRHLIKRGTM